MVIRMNAGKNYASFDAEIYLNPTNSRNLEFDGNKRIYQDSRLLSEATIQRLATKYRNDWLAKQSPQIAAHFTNSSFLSIKHEQGEWRVIFRDNPPNDSTNKETSFLSYLMVRMLDNAGELVRITPIQKPGLFTAGETSTWGTYTLYFQKIDEHQFQMENIRLTKREENGAVTTITARTGLLYPCSDWASININLSGVLIEKDNQKINTSPFSIVLRK